LKFREIILRYQSMERTFERM